MSIERQQDLFENPESAGGGEGLYDDQMAFAISGGRPPEPIRTVVKRSGREEAFDAGKIAAAILRAAAETDGLDAGVAQGLAAGIAFYLSKRIAAGPPTADQVSDAVEQVLIEMGHLRAGLAYARFRDRRDRIRRLRQGDVRAFLSELDEARRAETAPGREQGLTVQTSDDRIVEWDRARIAASLQREARLDAATAEVVAIEVERQVMRAGLTTLTASLVRELADAKLIELGRPEAHRRHMRVGVPMYDAEQLICLPNADEGLGGLNPLATDALMAGRVKREFALSSVFAGAVAEAHLAGAIHLYDLGAIDRLRHAALSPGLVTIAGLPAPHARRTLAPPLHAETAIAQTAQAHGLYRGHLALPPRWDGLNWFLEPLLLDGGERRVRESAQQLLAAFAHGAGDGAALSLWWDAPRDVREAAGLAEDGEAEAEADLDDDDFEAPSQGPGAWGALAQLFAWYLVEEAVGGDVSHRIIRAPRLIVEITPGLWPSPEGRAYLLKAAEAAAQGAPVAFRFRRGEAEGAADPRTLWQPRRVEAHRVALNLPRAAYLSQGDGGALIAEIETLLDVAVDAHLQKQAFLERLFAMGDAGPHGLLLRTWDGQPFCDLRDAEWAIEITGLNEAVQHLTGKELHEDEEAAAMADHILEHIAASVRQRAGQEGMRFVAAQPFQAEARRRFAMADGQRFPEQARRVVKTEGLTQDVAYTAGAQAAVGAPLTALERIELEARFQGHAPLDACAHVALPDMETSPEALYEVLRTAYERTNATQVAFDA